MWWRPPAVLAVILASVPVWERMSVAEIVLALSVPTGWILFLKPKAAGLLIGWVGVFAAITRVFGTWGAPPNFDDFFRGYLSVAWCIGISSTWRVLGLLPRAILLATACAMVVGVPDVRNVPLPGRETMMPEPAGVLVVSERAWCDSRRSCDRMFEAVATDGVDRAELKRRITAHLQSRGWAINKQHVDKACRPLGLLLNPYRGCVSISYNHLTGRTEVLHSTFNPREPLEVY